MTVIVKRMPSPVLAVRGYAQTGGVYEGKWLGGGLSHLFVTGSEVMWTGLLLFLIGGVVAACGSAFAVRRFLDV